MVKKTRGEGESADGGVGGGCVTPSPLHTKGKVVRCKKCLDKGYLDIDRKMLWCDCRKGKV